MGEQSLKGYRGFLAISVLVFILVIAYTLYPLILGPIGWSDKLTVSETGAKPRIIHDESEGTFVFWISNIFTHERQIEVAKINDNEIVEKKVIFTGNNQTTIEDFIVLTDHSGSAFVFFETWDDYDLIENLIILNLTSLTFSGVINIVLDMQVKIMSAKSGYGKILLLSHEYKLYNLHSNRTYETADYQDVGDVFFYTYVIGIST